MKEYIELQTQFCSKIDIKKICTFDYETITERTLPLYHRSPRFILVREGKGSIEIDRKRYELKSGVLLSILPWECTQVVEVKESLNFEIVKYNYDVVAENLKSSSCIWDPVSVLKRLEESPYAYLSNERKKEMEYLFLKIREEVGIESVMDFRERRSYQEINIIMLLSSLIIAFCRVIDNRDKIISMKIGLEDNRMLILRYIYMHLGEKITLERIAKQFYLSRSSVRMYVYKKTGLAFQELVSEMRIMKIINYLLYTDMTLEDIAPILGYVDAAHISKVFSSRMENKVSEYRRTYQKVLNITNIEEKRLAYQLVEYITKNYQEDIQALGTSEKFGISIEEMNRHLIMQVECNFSDFINRLRIDKSCEMLLDTNKSITDIAIEVGYGTVNTFRRNFIQLRHVLPNEFRTTQAKLVN
jgi:AraC-like DNA-binding protein